MDYYNEREIPYEDSSNYYIKRKIMNKNISSDNIYQTNKSTSLHNIYNQFLVSSYPPKYNYLYNMKYTNNTLNNNVQKNISIPIINRNNINYSSSYTQGDLNNKKNYKTIPSPLRIQRYQFNIKDNINNNENQLKDINNKNKYYKQNIIERPIEYNINVNNNCIDNFYTNNKNKLSLSYDTKLSNNYLLRNQYISPIITNIAKKNYMQNNPFSDKNIYLGPSALKSNPILYPIDTYKIDFNRYIRDNYVNKFI